MGPAQQVAPARALVNNPPTPTPTPTPTPRRPAAALGQPAGIADAACGPGVTSDPAPVLDPATADLAGRDAPADPGAATRPAAGPDPGAGPAQTRLCVPGCAGVHASARVHAARAIGCAIPVHTPATSRACSSSSRAGGNDLGTGSSDSRPGSRDSRARSDDSSAGFTDPGAGSSGSSGSGTDRLRAAAGNVQRAPT